MKVLFGLIIVFALVFGAIYFYKTYFSPDAASKTETVTVTQTSTPQETANTATDSTTEEKPAEAPPARTVNYPGDQPLSTANTPVSKSKIGKKINKIYSDHNKGLEKGGGD